MEIWDVERGLRDSGVTGISQAPDGYLWLSTLNGLAQFDGVRFRTYAGPWVAGLKIGGFNQLAVDGAGEVWALAEDGGLVCRHGSEFSTLGLEPPTNAVVRLYPSAAGEVWASLADGAIGLCRRGKLEVLPRTERFGGLACEPATLPDGSECLVARNGTLLTWQDDRLEPLKRSGASSLHAVGVASDGLGSAWVLGENSLWQWRGQQWTPVALPGNAVAAFEGVLCGPDHSIWIWNEAGIWRLGNGRWLSAKWPGPPATGFHPTDRLVDAEGRAWFGTRGQGLLAVSATGQVTSLTVREGLPSNDIFDLDLDQEGDVWAGTERGLVRLKPKQLSVISWHDAQGEIMATGIAQSGDGSLWMGTYGDGLLRFRGSETDSVAHVAFPRPKSCRGLAVDATGHLWVGSVREGLWRLEGDKLSQVELARLPGGEARTLLPDSHGRVWVGTTKGLFAWADGQLTPQSSPRELGVLDVRALVEDRDGGLWVGTQGQGLLRWREGSWEQVPAKPPAGLLSIWSLYLDRSGDLWIGTQGGGLARWRSGHLDLFNATNGLSADTICAILQDDRDNLWLGTYQGIVRVRKSECNEVADGRRARLEPRVFTESDGMPTLQCTGSFQPTACRTRGGGLCFPTIKGVVVVDPNREMRPSPPPAVFIEEVVVQGRSLPPRPNLQLGPQPGRLEFRFTALSFAAPERVRFRYRLDGEDKEWTEAGTERTAVYNALAPGPHAFRVTACNGDGVWNEQGAAVAFTVTPAWWQRRWLQLGAMGCAVALAAGAWRQVETRRLQRRLEMAKRQGALERERARIAQDIHDELGTSLTRIIMLSQSGDAESGPPSPELNRIHITARELTRAMDEVVWAVNPRQDTLEGLLSYASVFAQDFLNSARLGCRLDLPAKVPSLPLSAEVRHNVFLAVKEALHNAVRHAQAREVRFGLCLEAGEFVLEIADDGVGFEPGALTPASVPAELRRLGHGLQNMRERLEAIGGRCELRSNRGKGTTVRLHVPLPALEAV